MLFNDGYTELSYFRVLQTICEGLYETSYVTHGGDKTLDYNYSDDMTFNACAACKGKDDYIEMNVGTLATVFAYMKNAFSSPDCMKFVGNPEKEIRANITCGFDSVNKRLLFSGEPRDVVRSELSTYASLMMLRYIYSHELGHLLNGHVKYVDGLYSTPRMKMIEKKILAAKSEEQAYSYALDRRTLEMDADAFAATMSIDNIIMCFSGQGEFSFDFSILNSPVEIFALWSFSIQSIFMLFEYFAETKYDKLSYYLPNEARGLLSFSSSLVTLDNYRKHGIFCCDDDTYEDILRQISIGIKEAERHFNLVYNRKYDFFEHFSTNNHYFEFTEEVLNHWNAELRDRLVEYARVPLYNPDTIDETIENVKNMMQNR